MTYEPRTIALLCELGHPPQQPDPRPVQQIHNDFFQAGNPPYSSFAVTPMGPVLSNPAGQPGRVSQVLFLPDQIQFREEQGSLMAEHFSNRVMAIADRYSQARGIENYAGQRVTVRSLVNPQSQRDARALLDQSMFGQDSGTSRVTQHFGQKAELYGLRLAFEGTEPNSSIGMRIESYTADEQSLFVELQGAYGPLESHQGPDKLGSRIQELYDFLEERTLPFIQSMDRAQNG